eukprot:CAMPEP_0113846498 /NCGR_PEP_ID=MMETSP0372-20130328/1340_1 /TAXON_ID=340204 /ORGANISM="Lankesteria abbotti" /LENGTH=197 /DNA_ID=CAMNT_0000815647 /DNA_START=63 /DNA_END=656 /DNA_ORIENTATION=- /assembly_acc=CAM_ASM_000359
MTLVGKKAPNFSAEAVMPDGSFKKLSLDTDYKGKSVLLFFYPLDFTFVCPSEILAFDRAIDQFKERGVEVIACSVDSHFSHWAWRETPVNKGGIGPVKFPILSDLDKKITNDYGIMHSMGVSFRGLFFLDAEHNVHHSLVNDLPIGRSVEETLRIVDAVQFHQKHGEVCPANWKKGEKAIQATSQGIATYLGEAYGK